MMHPIPLKALSDNYIWVLPDMNSGSFLCVDPGESTPVIQFARESGLNLSAILITHHHADHINGIEKLLELYNPTVYGPKDARIPGINQVVSPDSDFDWNSYTFAVLAAPGHTATGINYFEKNHQWLFTGDTLFSAGCGRVFDGTLEQLHTTLMQYKSLPLSTRVYCGHEYTHNNLRFALWVEPENVAITIYQKDIAEKECTLPSTLGLELSVNPFLRTDKQSVIAWALLHGAKSASSLDVFATLREHKNRF